MYAVEIAMRAMAERERRAIRRPGDSWGCCMISTTSGIPTRRTRPRTSIRPKGCAVLAELGLPEDAQRAILGHANYTGVPRDTDMARALFAVDELCGFLVACALVRPSQSLQDLEVSSVKKKLKDKAFARGVSRDDVIQGAAEIGVPLDEHIAFVLGALRPHESRARPRHGMTGPRLGTAQQTVASAVNRAAGGRPVPGNRVELLIDGPDTYRAMQDVIAQRHPLGPLRELHHPERRRRLGLRRAAGPTRPRGRARPGAVRLDRLGLHLPEALAPSARARRGSARLPSAPARSISSPTSPATTGSWSSPTGAAR